MRPLVLASPLILALPASACLNDRDSDSLATQAAQFPDTLRVITGRFERNPPLYYQMRIRRELSRLQKSPRDFDLYDDIAVAFDRLHRDDGALQIMAKKRAVLPPFDAKNPAQKEAWYRYYANAGTFHAHYYLGEKSGDLAEMKVARAMIKRAIEIKPNAHFGREKYQLLAMDWIVAVKTKKTELALSDFLEKRDKWEDNFESAHQEAPHRAAAVEGLSGLIVLGAAWRSVDIFEALSRALENKNGVTLRHLSLRRCEELLRQGSRSLTPKALNLQTIQGALKYTGVNDYGVGVNDQNKKTLDQLFPKLSAEAEDENAERQSFMLARLEKGDHPDTNPKFWADWKPAAPPDLEVDWIDEGKQKEAARKQFYARKEMVFKGSCAAILAILCLGLWHFAKRRSYA